MYFLANVFLTFITVNLISCGTKESASLYEIQPIAKNFTSAASIYFENDTILSLKRDGIFSLMKKDTIGGNHPVLFVDASSDLTFAGLGNLTFRKTTECKRPESAHRKATDFEAVFSCPFRTKEGLVRGSEILFKMTFDTTSLNSEKYAKDENKSEVGNLLQRLFKIELRGDLGE